MSRVCENSDFQKIETKSKQNILFKKIMELNSIIDGDSSLNEDLIVGTKDDKSLQCNVCSRKYENTQTLKNHLTSHFSLEIILW